MRALIVVDMQNDFIDGTLGSKEAIAIVPKVKEKIEKYISTGDVIIFTADTHGHDYMNTQEGKHLPFPHCIKGTSGWDISSELYFEGAPIVTKETFGSLYLPDVIHNLTTVDGNKLEGIELVGVCTDICVISNALLLKAVFTETPIYCDASCCAGVTPEKHWNAIDVMESCQITVVNKNK